MRLFVLSQVEQCIADEGRGIVALDQVPDSLSDPETLASICQVLLKLVERQICRRKRVQSFIYRNDRGCLPLQRVLSPLSVRPSPDRCTRDQAMLAQVQASLRFLRCYSQAGERQIGFAAPSFARPGTIVDLQDPLRDQYFGEGRQQRKNPCQFLPTC
jgi:hypothetical protein